MQRAGNLSARLSITVETREEELQRLAEAVERFAEENAWPDGLTFKVNLILEELTLNVIRYGHDEGMHEVDVSIVSGAEGLTIEMADDGRPFDPLTDAAAPDLDASVEDRRIGGLGVHLTRSMTSDMRYRREDGKNCLTLALARDG